MGTNWRGAATVVVLLVAAFMLETPTAHANPDLTEGVEMAQQARFRKALAAFGRAEEGEQLTRSQLITLYRERALAFFALGRRKDMRTDLGRLASLEPKIELGEQFPPDVHSTFEELRAEVGPGITVDVSTLVGEQSISIEALTENDTAGLARFVRLHTRVDRGRWETTESGAKLIPTQGTGKVEYVAQVVGPGGAVVASVGTMAEPRVLRTGLDRVDEGGGSKGNPVVLGVSVGIAGAIVTAIILGAVVASGGGGKTQLSGPQLALTL